MRLIDSYLKKHGVDPGILTDEDYRRISLIYINIVSYKNDAERIRKKGDNISKANNSLYIQYMEMANKFKEELDREIEKLKGRNREK